MYRLLIAAVAAMALGLGASTAVAQCACTPVEITYAPAVTTYTTYSAPVVAATPTVTYYAPGPQVTCFAPTAVQVACCAPAPAYVTYYAPAPAYVAYYGPTVVLGRSMYGTLKAYVPGQPIRNVFRAITP